MVIGPEGDAEAAQVDVQRGQLLDQARPGRLRAGAAVPDGTSVKINEASNLPILKRVTGASAGTAEAINFNAQYVQTDATVAAGTANSMVTFALEYN